MKVLELFSGIGGMHFACKEAERLSNGSLQFNVVSAVDINTSANSVYKTNFPSTKLQGRNIQSISLEELNTLSPEVVLMSPPCQPFTRTGLKKDLADARCSALSHLILTLPHIQSLRYLLLENVKGFEASQSHHAFVQMLSSHGFSYQEFLLSPTQFGVPNSRTRYYLVARRIEDGERAFGFETSEDLITNLPPLKPGAFQLTPILQDMTLLSILDTTDPSHPTYEKYKVPDKDLVRRFNVLDIVNPGAPCTNCFTKAYTHYAEGTGSVLSNLDNVDTIAQVIAEANHLLQTQQNEQSSCQNKAKKIKLEAGPVEKVEENENINEKGNEDGTVLENIEKAPENVTDLDIVLRKDTTCIASNSITTDDVTNKGAYTAGEKSYLSINKSSDGSDTGANQNEGSLSTNSYCDVTNDKRTNQLVVEKLRSLNLRYFSPNEIRKLMCFPESFQFPASCSDKARYKLLGNSINVHVVAYCICLMLSEAT